MKLTGKRTGGTSVHGSIPSLAAKDKCIMDNRLQDCKCLLCKERNADKTGSHIVPSFIMKRINGDGMRDHEVGFEIRGAIVEPYFGRDIYEDKRREITENEEKMESRDNLDVSDYIFCTECEKYFGRLESAYAPSLSLSFSDSKTTINSKVSPSDALLFWCSIIWRVSVTGHLGQRLNTELEERLRKALSTNNTDDLNVKYALFRCKDYGKIEGKGTSVCIDIKDKAVLLVADDFMLVMVFDIGPKANEVQLMDIGISLNPDSLNDGIKPEEISPMPVSVFDAVMKSIMQLAVRSMRLPDKFEGLHNVVFGGSLPEELLTDILDLMQSHPCKMGDRYSVNHYAWCYKEVLKRHGYIRENGDNTFSVIRK